MVVPDSSEAVKVALLVPDNQAGKVVGKGGAVFQMLRAQGCDIMMQPMADVEQFRRADIKGPSGEHLAAGLTTICGRLGRGGGRSTAGGLPSGAGVGGVGGSHGIAGASAMHQRRRDGEDRARDRAAATIHRRRGTILRPPSAPAPVGRPGVRIFPEGPWIGNKDPFGPQLRPGARGTPGEDPWKDLRNIQPLSQPK